jgi:DDE superfamily endonuclease
MIMKHTAPFTTLRQFRTDLYDAFDRRADALFDLVDALLTTGGVPSPAHLSLAPPHQRGWGSLYAALRKGRIDRETLLWRVAQLPLAGGEAVYAVDSSVWARCDAETSPARGFYYHPSRHSAGQPIVAGWSYQWVAQLSFVRDSWTAPLEVRRVAPGENSHEVAVAQIRALLRRQGPSEAIPLFVFDAGYDPVPLTLALAEEPVAVLVRMRSDRCFFGEPPHKAKVGSCCGPPFRHGAKFDCKQPATWPAPTGEHHEEDDLYGAVRVRCWAGLHARPKRQVGHGHGRRPVVPGTVVLVEVSRLPGHSRKPQVLWLWWAGPGSPDLAVLWKAYVRRFDLEHTFRFLKQTLSWTTPRLRHPEQADRWTLLVLAAYTQLRLARALVADRRLPWERPQAPGKLTPCRVQRAFGALLPALGTLASAPRPCGRSPGRPKGRLSGRAPRYPAIKRSA